MSESHEQKFAGSKSQSHSKCSWAEVEPGRDPPQAEVGAHNGGHAGHKQNCTARSSGVAESAGLAEIAVDKPIRDLCV